MFVYFLGPMVTPRERRLNPPRNLYPLAGRKVLADVVLGLAILLTPLYKTLT